MFSVLQGHLPKPDQHPPMETEDSLWLLMVKCWTRQPAQRPAMNEVGIEVSLGTRWFFSTIHTNQAIERYGPSNSA